MRGIVWLVALVAFAVGVVITPGATARPLAAISCRANLDGSNPNQSFVPAGIPWALAIDSGHIYWADTNTGTIGRANLDGSNPNQSFITPANVPYGVAVDSGHVYWTNASTGSIGRANLDGTHRNQNFIPTHSFPFGIAVDPATCTGRTATSRPSAAPTWTAPTGTRTSSPAPLILVE
jgi:streptogramin lyase